ncbi:hypothetical protein NFI96_007144 [Prochilodus magdalenae]|nr:hypothetical protein NFI96_007144 [Prochilodus magdalenae]
MTQPVVYLCYKSASSSSLPYKRKTEELIKGKEMDNGCGKETRPPKYMLMTALEDEPEVVAQSQFINPAVIAAAAHAVVAGVSLFGTSVDRISQAINTNRNVSIEITNKSSKYILTNPRTYTNRGYCYHPPQPTITKDVHQVCSFSKTAHTACGSSGVLMYQILNKEKKDVGELAIMFSVPFDYNWNKNMFALGIYNANHPCDDKLFNEMYKRTGPFTRGAGCVPSYFKHATVQLLLKKPNLDPAVLKNNRPISKCYRVVIMLEDPTTAHFQIPGRGEEVVPQDVRGYMAPSIFPVMR